MGGAVSTGNRDKRFGENSIIPLGQAHQHMHIYQHRGNGEILVLIDEDVASIEGIRHAEWDLMKVHGKQQDYFQKVKVNVEIPAKNVTMVSSLKDTLPPRSQRSVDSKTENDSNNLNAQNNSSSTMPRTPSGLSTSSGGKTIPTGNSNNNSGSGRGIAADFEAGSKMTVSSSLPSLVPMNNMIAPPVNNMNSNLKESASTPSLILATANPTGDIFYTDERMKNTLTTLKNAAVGGGIVSPGGGGHPVNGLVAEAKHSPRGLNMSSSINSFSSFDNSGHKNSSEQYKYKFNNLPFCRRQVGDRRRFEPRPYFPPAQRILNDRSLDDINSQSSWSQSQSQSQSLSQFSQGGGAKDESSLRSFHSVESEKLFSSGHVPRDALHAVEHSANGNGMNQVSQYQQLFSSMSNRQVQCKDCGRIFLGVSAMEALRDHAASLCSERQMMRQAFEKTNEGLLMDLQDLLQLESYDSVRPILPRLVRNLDDLGRRLRSYLVQIANMQHMNANFSTARRLSRSLERLLQDVERFISEVHNSLLHQTAPETNNGLHIGGNVSESDSSAMMLVFRYLSGLQVLAQRAIQRLQDKMFVMQQFDKAIFGLDHFDFLRTVGKGGYGSVYIACRKADRALAASIATQNSFNNPTSTNQWTELLARSNDPGILASAGVPLYAIKTMRGDEIRRQQTTLHVMREKMFMAQANKYSDFFVRMLCSFTHESLLFLAMEYCPGGDCFTLLSAMGRFPEIVAQHFVAQVCVAVQHMHLHGVVHRDIKPDNVMITARGHAKLGDFGLTVPFPAAAISATRALLPVSQSSQMAASNNNVTTMSSSVSTSASIAPPITTPRNTIQQAQRQQQQLQQSVANNNNTLLNQLQQFHFPQWLSGTEESQIKYATTNYNNNGEVVVDEPLLVIPPWSPIHSQTNNMNISNSNNVANSFSTSTHLTQNTQMSFSSSSHPAQISQPVQTPFWVQESTSKQLQQLCQTQLATVELLQSKPHQGSNNHHHHHHHHHQPAQSVLHQSQPPQTSPNPQNINHSYSEPPSSLSLKVPSNESSSSLFFGHINNPGTVQQMNSRVGNIFYSCPEIVVGKQYDHTVDYWAIAVMTFHFVAGCTPFDGGDDRKKTMDNIVMHAVNWQKIPSSISNECKFFIEAILCPEYSYQRLGFHSASDVLNHPFFWDVDFATLYEGYGPLYPQLPAMSQPTTVNTTAMGISSSSNNGLFAPSVHSEDARSILPPIANNNSEQSSLLNNNTNSSSAISNHNSNTSLLALHMQNMQRMHSSASSTSSSQIFQNNNNNGNNVHPSDQLPLFTLLGEEEMAAIPDFFEADTNSKKPNDKKILVLGGQRVSVSTVSKSNKHKDNDSKSANIEAASEERDLECYTLYP